MTPGMIETHPPAPPPCELERASSHSAHTLQAKNPMTHGEMKATPIARTDAIILMATAKPSMLDAPSVSGRSSQVVKKKASAITEMTKKLIRIVITSPAPSDFCALVEGPPDVAAPVLVACLLGDTWVSWDVTHPSTISPMTATMKLLWPKVVFLKVQKMKKAARVKQTLAMLRINPNP